MTIDRDVSPVVRSWLEQRDQGLPDPSHGFDRFLQLVESTPQVRRRWWAPGRPGDPPPTTRRSPSVFSTTRLIAAIGMVALGTGALFFAASPGPAPAPTVSPAPSPSSGPVEFGPFLPPLIPAGLDSGVVDTPIGAARWVRMGGDPTTLPFMSDVLAGPAGLLMFDGGGHGPIPCDHPAARPPAPGSDHCLARPDLWESADALTWSPRTLPAAVADAEWADLTLLDGVYWLVTSRPAGLWRSTDASQWEVVDLSALVSPGPSSLDWEVILGAPATWGAGMALPVTYRALDAGRILGQTELGRVAHPRAIEPGRYQVTGGYGEDLGIVDIEETASGIRVADENGVEIGRLDGVGADFVREWETNHAIVDHHVGLVVDGSVVPVSLPEPPVPDDWGHGRSLQLLGVADGLVALAADGEGGILRWHSPDGRTWYDAERIRLESPVFDVGVMTGDGRPPAVTAYGAGPVAGTNPNDFQAWVSPDGRTWTTTRGGIGVGSGWLTYDYDAARTSIRTDEGEWVGVPTLGIGRPDGMRIAAAGDIAFLWSGYGEGQPARSVLIVEFGADPGR